MEKLILIDGNSLANRAFYALPPLTTLDGVPSQAVYGFATMLIKVITDKKPDYIAVAFDLPQPTFRHIKYPEYKAGRKKMPDELGIQFPMLKEMLAKMNVTILEKPGFEADDIIGTMAKKNPTMTYIVTGDRDSLQLIDDTTSVIMTRRGISDILELNAEVLMREYSLTPAQVIDYKALAGDASDNIPGVRGVGDKTATNLIKEYGTLDNIYANLDKLGAKLAEKLRNERETAYLSQYLATIDIDVDIDCDIKKCTYPFPFSETVREYFNAMGFKTLVKRGELFTSSEETVKKTWSKPPCEVRLIESTEELARVCGEAKERAAVHIGDFISIALDETTEYIVNLSYSLIDNGLEYNACLSAMAPLLENPDIIKVVCDAKALKKTLKYNRIELNNFWDVKLAQYLVDMTVDYSTAASLVGSYGIDNREIGTGLLYLRGVLEEELTALKMHRLYYDIELPLVSVLFKMEQCGFKVDIQMLSELGIKYTKRIEQLSGKIYELAGKTFNINSPKQLGKVLFEDLKIPYPKKTVNYSTSAEILEQVADKHEIIEIILAYRFVSKLNSTYIEGMRKLIDGKGVIHTEFRQMLTTTGRLSSVEPNLQNIPVREEEGKALRGLFIASEGRTLVSADYSQIELRLMAHFSGDEKMVDAYRNNGDIHLATAAEVFGLPPEEVTSKMRRMAKAVNFGIIYGISDYGLAQNLKIPNHQAKEYINRYFERFSGVKRYLDESVERAKKCGYAETLLGRIRRIPELYSPNYNVRQFGERVAMNMPLQGSAADIIKIAMLQVDRALEGKKSKLILQVHDELIVDAADDEVEEIKQILIDKMTHAVELAVPLTVEVGEGKSWLDT